MFLLGLLADLRRIPWADGTAPGTIACNPADPGQPRNLTLRLSEDDGASWSRQLLLHPGSAAYSCLVALPVEDGRSAAIGCLFEADGHRRILLARVLQATIRTAPRSPPMRRSPGCRAYRSWPSWWYEPARTRLAPGPAPRPSPAARVCPMPRRVAPAFHPSSQDPSRAVRPPLHHLLQVVHVLLATAWIALRLHAQSPNVLVIVADDFGVDCLNCYQEGNDLPSTPNLDALSARGVLFRNAYAYPSCSPTRAAILTGRHPCRTMVGRWIHHENNTNPVMGVVGEREHTLPELLDRAQVGYTHACIGKWHMHDASFGPSAPRDLGGYGTFTGGLGAQLPSYFQWPRVENGVEQTNGVYATTQETDDAIGWIQAQPGPWFCYLAYHAPHAPLHVPPPTLHNRNITPNSPPRDLYLAAIEAMDNEIGRLFTTLGPTVMANTNVIFLGDNGTLQGIAVPPFLGNRAKTTPYEGGINVPLVCAGPAVTSPGREVTALACAVDVFSTVLQLAGAQAAVPSWLTIDGRSLVPYLQNTQQAPLRPFAFSEEFVGDTWPAPISNGVAIVRNDRYKLISRVGGYQELFDLQADPFEQSNLLGSPLTPAQLQAYGALAGELARMRQPIARWQPFGSGCMGSNGAPTAICSGPPRFGTTIQMQLGSAAPGTIAVLGLGLSHRQQGMTTLPFDLAAYGAASGCMQWCSLDAIHARITDAAGSAAVPLTVPNLPSLLETTVFGDYFVFDPGAPNNPLGLVSTAGFAAIVGS